MRRIGKFIGRLVNAAIVFAAANVIVVSRATHSVLVIFLLYALFVVVNVVPSWFNLSYKTMKIRNCANGCELLYIFLLSTATCCVVGIMTLAHRFPGIEEAAKLTTAVKIWDVVVIFLVECVVFWNGMIRIYISSTQLGVRYRVLGAICGMIPIVHLFVLGKLLCVVSAEVEEENDKYLLDEQRKTEQICRTQYPILMVHGVFFRDFRYLNYWGRIPGELEKNGATVFYGNHQSAAGVPESGREIADRIEQICRETGCEKVNIIAHSKGGLDSRYAIAMLGASERVASLTTINTPHRGCEFADYLLSKIPAKQQEMVAKAYNTALHKLGDPNPNFLAAVYDLTAARCAQMNEEVKDAEGVYYQSIGSKLNKATGGRFPLNFSYQLVNYFDGANDGLVGEQSFPWGSNYRFLTVSGKRGISHGDMIDLNRENFKGFDVREFYVQLVADLKKRGM